MINRLSRLNLSLNSEFFSQANRRYTKTLIIFSHKINDKKIELAVRVRKVNVKSAAKRNDLKRRIKELVKSNIGSFKQGEQLLLVTRADCGILNPLQVLEDLEQNLS